MMRTRLNYRGFSLVEMLVVMAILALLMAIILPSMQSARRAAKAAVCASNMHQIQHAWQDQTIEWTQKGTGFAAGGGWVSLLAPSMKGQRRVFLCPEDEVPSYTPSLRIKVLHHNNTTFLHYMPLEVGPLTEMRNASGEPGKPGYHWELWFEDIRPGGGDRDFDDVWCKMDILEDGSIKATFYKGSAGYHFYIVDDTGRVIINDLGRQDPSGSWAISGMPASYAINEYVRGTHDRPSSIFFMDYDEQTLAFGTDDWYGGKFVDEDTGMPTFARHPNHTMNVMFRDGSVRLMYPWEVEPTTWENRWSQWNTGAADVMEQILNDPDAP